MSRLIRWGALVAVGSWFVVTVGSHSPTEAQFGGLGSGFGQPAGGMGWPDFVAGGPEMPAPRVFLTRPVSKEAAKIWAKLGEPIAMPFATDTPLADALEYIRQATADEGMTKGIPIYVDDIGLQEAEQSLQSPIKVDLEGMPLRLSLELMLDQLDLAYDVRDEGLLVITSIESEDAPIDPMALILDELRALRQEVDALKGQGGATSPDESPAIADELEALRDEVGQLRRSLEAKQSD